MSDKSPWLSLKQLCKYIGISKETAYRYIYSGKIPCYKLGKLYKFHKEEIDIWVCSGGDL
jgi:excisionase family DNA binding protein